jgi:hypothetical protein
MDALPDPLGERIREHMGGPAKGLPVVSRALEGYQRANFQVGIDQYLEHAGREAELIGLPMTHGYRVGLAELARGVARGPWGREGAEEGPVEFEPVDVDELRIMCVAAGLWLIKDEGEPLLLMLRRSDHGPHEAELGIEIMAREREIAERTLGEVERLMGEHNVYRGRILVLSRSQWGGVGIEVQRLPKVTRERIVFPPGVLERIERHTKTFEERVDAPRGRTPSETGVAAPRPPGHRQDPLCDVPLHADAWAHGALTDRTCPHGDRAGLCDGP